MPKSKELIVNFKMNFPAYVKKEGDVFVSVCPLIDVCSHGKTRKLALENLVEAVSLFLISCFERGTLESVLKDCGFKPVRRTDKTKKATKSLPPKYSQIEVPLPFSVSTKGLAACPA